MTHCLFVKTYVTRIWRQQGRISASCLYKALKKLDYAENINVVKGIWITFKWQLSQQHAGACFIMKYEAINLFVTVTFNLMLSLWKVQVTSLVNSLSNRPLARMWREVNYGLDALVLQTWHILRSKTNLTTLSFQHA